MTNEFWQTVGNTAVEVSDGLWEGFKTITGINFIMDQANNLKNYITDSVIEGLIGTASEWYAQIADKVVVTFLDKFRPDVTLFLKFLGDTNMFDIFGIIGMVLAVFILAISMIAMFKPWASTYKDTPFSLIVRFFIAGLLVYFGLDIMQGFFNVTNSIWDILIGMDITAVDGNHDILMRALIPTNLVEVIGFNIVSGPLGMLLVIIFGIKIFKEFLKLILEVVERYCVACILYFMFPAVAGTIVSSVTVSIFKKYFQMLIVQLIMLLMNLLFIRLIMRMLTIPISVSTLTGWIFSLAFIKCAQKIDSYLYTMGMSVAVTGSSLFDSIGSSTRALTSMIRGAQNGLTATGGMLTKAGVMGGGAPLARAGMAFSSFAHPSKGGMNGNIGMLQEAAKNGTLSSFSKKLDTVDNEMINVARAGGKDAQLLNKLNNDVKNSLFEQAFGNQCLPENATLSNLQWNNDHITGELTSNADPSLSTAFKVSPVPDDRAFATLTGNEGESLYMSASGNLEPGQVCGYSYDEGNLQIGDVLSNNRIGELENIRDDVSYLEGADNGGIILKDRSQDTLAYLDKDGGAHYNIDGMQLTQKTMSNINALGNIDPATIRFNDNGNDTITVIGREVGSDIGREYNLYNRSIYHDRTLPNGDRAITSFGKNNANTGSYYVAETRDSGKGTYSNLSEKYKNSQTIWRKKK